MKISTEIDSIAEICGERKAVEYVAKAGFDAWDFSMFKMFHYDYNNGTFSDSEHPLAKSNYLQFARELKQAGLDNGIVCNQSHAPFPSCKKVMPYLKRAIECTKEAGGEICIIHPANNDNAEQNAEMYNELLPFAKDCGVKIACENMFNWDYKNDHAVFASCSTPESFNELLDAVNDEYLVACLDIGHSEMYGLNTSAEKMIHALGKRLKALHIHDNDLFYDLHQIPFSMKIDFEKVVRALKDIGYNGYFTLEACYYLGKNAYTEEELFKKVKELAYSAQKLAEMFEK